MMHRRGGCDAASPKMARAFCISAQGLLIFVLTFKEQRESWEPLSRCNMVLGMMRKHSALLFAALPRACSTARPQGLLHAGGKVYWFGLWCLQGKEGRKSVEVSAQNGWTCLAAEHTNLYVKPYAAIPTHPFQSFSTAIPALSVGACTAAQAALVSGVLPLTLHAVFKKIL